MSKLRFVTVEVTKYHPLILIDTGVIVAYYNAKDEHHASSRSFFERCTSQLVTTVACVTESMQLLASSWQVQNEFLMQVGNDVFHCEHLLAQDFSRIAELNMLLFSDKAFARKNSAKYAALPGDFADLALVSISERLDIAAIATLDSDFDIYQRYRSSPFERVFWS